MVEPYDGFERWLECARRAVRFPSEGGCLLVRARDKIFRVKDLKGKKIGISKSLNTIKNDWWRIPQGRRTDDPARLAQTTA